MNIKRRRLSDCATGVGAASLLFACWLLVYCEGFDRLGEWLLVLGMVLMFVGFWNYVRAKGYHPAWTLLFFIFGPVVFLAFFFMPDRYADNRAA